MGALKEAQARDDILKRLRRIEGQVRGVARMIEEDKPCMSVAHQLSAVRKAIDSVFSRMTVCYLEQELDPVSADAQEKRDQVLADLGALLRKVA